MNQKKIYTLGTGRRSEEDFIEILLLNNIAAVIDVRRFPRSKIKTFTKEYLENLLIGEGISYIFLGEQLGGFRKGGYEAYTETNEFKAGIEKLEGFINTQNVVIICAEKFPWKCHRKWIARELRNRHYMVEHIIEKGKVRAPK